MLPMLYREFSDTNCTDEIAARHELALGNTFVPQEGAVPPKSEVHPEVSSLLLVILSIV